MISIETFDLEVSEERQAVYIYRSAIFRHLHNVCVHGRDYIRVTYEYKHGEDMQEHHFLVLSEGARCDINYLAFLGAACVNQAAMLVYCDRTPIALYPTDAGKISVSQSIDYICIT